MLVKGINNEPHNINKLKEIVEKIAPDKIHLNTVVRPPSEKYAHPLSIEELQRVENIFGDNAEIIASFKAERESAYLVDTEKIILDMMQWRPITLEDICGVTGLHRNEVLKYLDQLHRNRKIKLTEHDNRNYYEILCLAYWPAFLYFDNIAFFCINAVRIMNLQSCFSFFIPLIFRYVMPSLHFNGCCSMGFSTNNFLTKYPSP